MNTIEAIQALSVGKKVRNKDWKPGAYAQVIDNQLHYISTNERKVVFSITYSGDNPNNWEEYTQKERVSFSEMVIDLFNHDSEEVVYINVINGFTYKRKSESVVYRNLVDHIVGPSSIVRMARDTEKKFEKSLV